MVDNVTLNTGTGGDVIATEDVAGVEFQKVKLVDGTPTSTTAIPLSGDLANGLDVDVTRVGGTVTVDLGANNDVTVTSGTITANLGATDNAVLDTIATNTGAAIATGANTIGEVTIGAASTAAGDLAKAEDAVHTTGDVGVMGLFVRQDTQADFGADGDYVPGSVDANGAIRVNAVNADGTSNIGTASGATDAGAVMLGIRDDALTTLADPEGDYVGFRLNSTGALHVTGGGGGQEYTVDAAAPAAPTGSAPLMERDDALSTLTEVAGDWIQQRCDAKGSMWVNANDDSEDSNNSTTTPLGISATYTGTGTDILGHSSVTVNIFADQDSAANGMRFEFSQDNTNWDKSHQHDYTASAGRTFQFTAQARYFRVVFVNGTTGQAAFRVQTLLHRQPSSTTIHRMDADLAPDRSGTAVKAVIHAQAAGSGNFTPIDATAGGNLKTSISEISDGLDIGAGNAGTETARVSISTDDVNLASINTDMTTVAGAVAGTEMQVDVVAALPAGTNNIGDVDIASALPAGTNNIGDVDVATIAAGSNLVGDVGLSGARTSGGTTLYKNIDVDESEDAVKASAGQVYWIHAINTNAALRYLKFYNATVGTVVVGTTVPDLTFPVPASATGAGFTLSIPNGIAFGTAITIAATTGVADADSGAPGANEVIVNLGYA